MTLMPRKLIAEQSSNAKIPAEDLRLALSGLLAPGATANSARPGVLRGSGAPGFTGCQVLAPSASTFTVKQGSFIVQQVTSNGGAYIGVIDSDQTVSIAASLPSAGGFKAGYLIAHCYDSAYGDSQDGFAIEPLLGVQASSAAAAAYPTVPNNALVLAGFTVNASGTITLTSTAVFTGVHTGILPAQAGETASGDYDGQWRDEPVKGIQRWFAAASSYSASATWARPLVAFLGSGASFPASAQDGDVFLRTDLGVDGGTLWVNTAHATSPWRYAESGAMQVANQAGRDVVTAVAYAGLRVVQIDTGFEWEWSPVTNGWIPITPLIGKLWRHSNFSGALAVGSTSTVVLDSSRLGPGITTSGFGLVLPLSGIWIVRGTSYLSGGTGTGEAVTLVNRSRSGVADLAIARVFDNKTTTADRGAPFGVTGVPLQAGDVLTLQINIISGNGGVNYYGSSEAAGVTLEAEWKAPLNGVTPL